MTRLEQTLSTSSVAEISGLAALLGVLAAAPAAAQLVQTPPPELSFLSTVLKVRTNIPYEMWGEVKFPSGNGVARQGKHWFILAETAKGTDPVTEWNKIRPAFLQNGWTLVKEFRTGGLLETLQYAQNGVQAWANVDTDGSPLLFRVDVIEIAPLPFTLTLTAPAATPAARTTRLFGCSQRAPKRRKWWRTERSIATTIFPRSRTCC